MDTAIIRIRLLRCESRKALRESVHCSVLSVVFICFNRFGAHAPSLSFGALLQSGFFGAVVAVQGPVSILGVSG